MQSDHRQPGWRLIRPSVKSPSRTTSRRVLFGARTSSGVSCDLVSSFWTFIPFDNGAPPISHASTLLLMWFPLGALEQPPVEPARRRRLSACRTQLIPAIRAPPIGHALGFEPELPEDSVAAGELPCHLVLGQVHAVLRRFADVGR